MKKKIIWSEECQTWIVSYSICGNEYKELNNLNNNNKESDTSTRKESNPLVEKKIAPNISKQFSKSKKSESFHFATSTKAFSNLEID